MTALEAALRQICADLTEAHSSFAVVGGLAISARTEPRFTRDADIAVAVASDVVAEANMLELLPQLHVRVATTAHLIALKVLARDDVTRPQDIGDLRALIGAASPADLGRARAALVMIAQRGYHRGRDLETEFDALLHRQR